MTQESYIIIYLVISITLLLTSQNAWLSHSRMVGPECLSWISQNSSTDLSEIGKYFTVNIWEHSFRFLPFCAQYKSLDIFIWKQRFINILSFIICGNLIPQCHRPFEITPPNVWPHHSDIFVPVKAGLLMHKAQGMHEFMGNHSNPEAVGALKRHGLSSTTSTKVGPTPELLIIKGLSV